jgi:hypothetical protein
MRVYLPSVLLWEDCSVRTVQPRRLVFDLLASAAQPPKCITNVTGTYNSMQGFLDQAPPRL